jgi:hypothetical protein
MRLMRAYQGCYSAFFRYGASLWTRWMMPRPFTGTISVNSCLTRLDVRLLRWLLPPLVRTTTPVPVTLKRFEVALWVFSLYFVVVCLRGTSVTPFHTKPRLGSAEAEKRQTWIGSAL